MPEGSDRSLYLALAELVRRHAHPTPSGLRTPLTASELRGFSQNGEDGVIAEILSRIGIREQYFVEFGVESGREGNCVFLADVLSWRGLFLEADPDHFHRLANKYSANARVTSDNAEVTPENIEALLRGHGTPVELDVLSIDIDGGDYWVWEAIVSCRPRVVVIEYNAALGTERRLVQPRGHAEGWNGTDFFGASLPALEDLGRRKGYRLVHTDLAACNAFFVRDDLVADRFATDDEVPRWGQPNYFMLGGHHPHDPRVEEFVDPLEPQHSKIENMADPPRPEPDHPEPLTPAAPVKLNTQLSLAQRIALTYRYHGTASIAYRLVTYPLRYTPLRHRLRRGLITRRDRAAGRWYKKFGRPVTIVIPSYRDADRVSALVASVRRTTDSARVSIVVADDASGSDHVAALRVIPGIRVIEGERNVGFAANVNRGLEAADPTHDVVLLNSDTVARSGWLEALQYGTTRWTEVGIVGAKLLYGDGRIQFAGTVRNLGAPEWFDHRFRFRAANFGPANIPQFALAVSGACMYITRKTLDRVGAFDESYPMAYEDVDFCLRAWQAGVKVLYWPTAVLDHTESVTRGTLVGERERTSQRVFWDRWGDFFDARNVRTDDGALRVVYVTEDTGVGGGHRDIFEHLNRLRDRGHAAELWTLGDAPEWFELHVPVRSFDNYDDLADALAPVDAIKVATWWATAEHVWRASVLNGIPVYFVQDIETSYYAGHQAQQDAVLASYRHEFRYMTISSWNRDRLRELHLEAELIPPGIDLQTFRPRDDVSRRGDMVLALGRSNPLKNLPLTLDAWRTLPEPRPELCLFGIEPDVARVPGIRYVTAPTDDEVNELFNQATVFVQTSIHEGFCLPPLESMAAGGAVVCTDAHGNRDFCRDGENCLISEAKVEAVSAAIGQLLADADLRERLGTGGVTTAAAYAWERRIDALEAFLVDVARPRLIEPSTDAVPQLQRPPAG